MRRLKTLRFTFAIRIITVFAPATTMWAKFQPVYSRAYPHPTLMLKTQKLTPIALRNAKLRRRLVVKSKPICGARAMSATPTVTISE